MAAKPGRLAGTWVLGHAGHLQSSYVSALPVRGGCEPSPTHSHSLGTNCQQLESLRALTSTERAGVGMHWKGVRPVVFCRGSSVHTLSMGGSGSSCIGLPFSMPGGNVWVPEYSAQRGCSSVDGNRSISSPWLLADRRRPSTRGRKIAAPGQRQYPLLSQSSWGWVNSCSAVSRAVGNPRRGINLQAFEKWSTATRMHVWSSDSGKSVTKSIPMYGQGRRGIGMGTSLPTRKWWGVDDMAQTEQLQTYLMTSRDILGHQYRAWRSERVRWLPGCLEPGTPWTEPRKEPSRLGGD